MDVISFEEAFMQKPLPFSSEERQLLEGAFFQRMLCHFGIATMGKTKSRAKARHALALIFLRLAIFRLRRL